MIIIYLINIFLNCVRDLINYLWMYFIDLFFLFRYKILFFSILNFVWVKL